MSVSTSGLPRLRPDGTPRGWAITLAKFVLSASVCTVLYAVIIILGMGGVEMSSTSSVAAESVSWDNVKEPLRWLAWMVSGAVPAAFVWLHSPSETVDRYHRFGRAFAMFITINITVSSLFLMYHFGFTDHFMNAKAPDYVLYWAVGSVGIPPAYVGSLIAAKWANRPATIGGDA